MEESRSGLDKFFKIKEKGSNVATEIRAGLTTFATMSYILPVNVTILGVAFATLGGNTEAYSGAVFMATAISAVVGTLLMAFLAGLPFAQAPGMGLNAFFTYTVVLTMGYAPQFALAAVLTEGVIFIILSLTGIRTALFNAIPQSLKVAVSAGIGLFIMFIGLQNAGFIVGDPATLVAINPNLRTAAVALFIFGLAITILLYIKRVKGALLIGILITWILGIIAQLVGWYVVDIEAGVFSLLPTAVVELPPSIMPTLGICFSGFAEAFSSLGNIGSFLVVVLTFLYVDIFDTLGTLSGVATKANMLDENGELPGVNGALTADAVATTLGAILGTSTVTTFVESSAGVEEGGRSGFTSVITALCFLVSIFLYPIVRAIPSFATATALVMVGIMMFEPLKDMDFTQADTLIPGVITVAFMVMGYSISAGLMWGVLSYILCKVITKKFGEITPLMWVLGVIFILKIVVLDRFTG